MIAIARLSLCFVLLAPALSPAAQNAAPAAGFEQPPFGRVRVMKPEGELRAVVLFLSGDGGWEKIVADMCQALRKEGAMVVGVDLPAYLRRSAGPHQKCFYPAGHLEELAKAAEQYAGFPAYRTPLLAGYSSGATLAYVALAQAPGGTFSGALSMGFCPDLEVIPEPCQQNGLHCHRVKKPVPAWLLDADPAMTAPWVVLHGAADQCCTLQNAEAFVRQIPTARLVALPKVGHGYKVEQNWLPQFKSAFAELSAVPATRQTSIAPSGIHRGGTQALPPALEAPWWKALSDWLGSSLGLSGQVPQSSDPLPADPLDDLPLLLTPAAPGAPASDRMAVFISGDGGWKDFDQHICDELAAQGVPVVGLNALKYFWTARTPEATAWDLTRILQAYEKQWGKKQVLLIGYSFGADVLPFIFNRLNDAEKKQVTTLTLISPSQSADFEFHLGSWANRSSADARPVKPELEKMPDRRVLFLCGSDEDPSWLRPLARGSFQLKTLPGGHHYGGNTQLLSDAVLDFSK